MPHITLDLVSLDGKPLSGLSRRFEGEGGTIGRDEGNTLALPDSSRRVSRLHAAVSFPGGVPTITNSSAVLPISVGGLELECGQAMPLLPGMQLEIGPYVLGVRAAEVPAPMAPAPAPPHAAAPHHAPAAPWAPPPGAAVANLDSLFPAALPAQGGPAYPSSPAGPWPVPSDQAGKDPFADLLGGLGPASPVPMAPPAAAGPMDDPLAGLFGAGAPSGPPIGAGAGAPDPFAGLGFGPDVGVSSPAPHALGGRPETALPPPAAVIPEDFNPFDLPSASQRNSADPLASLMEPSAVPAGHALTASEQSIDVLFGSTGASGGFLANDMSGGDLLGSPVAPISLLEPQENSNPLAMFGDDPLPDERARPMRDDLAEIGGAYEPPRALDPLFSFGPAQPPPPAIPPPPVPSAAAAPAPNPFAPPQPPAFAGTAMPSYPADALTRAFLTGANLPASALPQGLTPEIMAVVGSLLHSATAGAIGMLAIRANIKREVQANVTIISSEANNPLKFLPDADTVLQQLLGKKIPGFMGPDEAMKDAFNDLRAHELGVIAGTRAALGEVLGKFDPAVLSDRLVGGSLLERALPAVRKTKLWDLYLERYAHIRREAEDDFQSIFGKAFVEAYEHETARMKAQAGRAPRQ